MSNTQDSGEDYEAGVKHRTGIHVAECQNCGERREREHFGSKMEREALQMTINNECCDDADAEYFVEHRVAPRTVDFEETEPAVVRRMPSEDEVGDWFELMAEIECADLETQASYLRQKYVNTFTDKHVNLRGRFGAFRNMPESHREAIRSRALKAGAINSDGELTEHGKKLLAAVVGRCSNCGEYVVANAAKRGVGSRRSSSSAMAAFTDCPRCPRWS